jgi:hypothetical protein
MCVYLLEFPGHKLEIRLMRDLIPFDIIRPDTVAHGDFLPEDWGGCSGWRRDLPLIYTSTPTIHSRNRIKFNRDMMKGRIKNVRKK